MDGSYAYFIITAYFCKAVCNSNEIAVAFLEAGKSRKYPKKCKKYRKTMYTITKM